MEETPIVAIEFWVGGWCRGMVPGPGLRSTGAMQGGDEGAGEGEQIQEDRPL